MEYRPFDFDNPDQASIPDRTPELDSTIVMGSTVDADTAVLDPVSGEVPGEDQREIDIAFHAAKILAAETKAERSRGTMERMARKDRLYTFLGNSALGRTITITEPDGSTPKAKTWAERHMELRLDQKTYDRSYKQYKRDKNTKLYRGEASDTTGFRTIGSTQARLSKAESEYRAGKMSARDLRLEKIAIAANLKGLTARERERAGLSDDEAGPNFASENPAQKRTRRSAESAKKKAARAAKQPIAGRWRELRYNSASKKYGKHMSVADQHREALRLLDPSHPVVANETDDDDIIDPADVPTVVTTLISPPEPGDRDYSDLVSPGDDDDDEPDSWWAPFIDDDEDTEAEPVTDDKAVRVSEPAVMYTPAGSRIEPSVIAIASRTSKKPAPTPELGTDNNEEAAKTTQPSTPETRARRRIIPAESTDTSTDSKPAKPSAKPLRTIGTPTPEEKSKEAIIDPWNAALKYVSALRAKYGSSLSMSPESIRKHLVEANVDEAEAEETALEIFRRMQKEKIVDGRPLVKGGGTGRRVLMDSDNILGRLNKMNEE